MTRSDLERLDLGALRGIARDRGYVEADSLERDELLDFLAEAPHPGLDVPSSTAPARALEMESDAMARLYLAQGRPDRAAEIWRKLLEHQPGDGQLASALAEAEAALVVATRVRGVIPPAPRSTGEPFGMLDLEEPPDGYSVDECEIIARDPHHLFTYWEVTDGGLGEARRHLGDEATEAKLVLRVFTASADARGTARDTRDHSLDGMRGRRYLPAPRPGAVVRAAVGLVARSGLFLPIAHSSTLRVPHAEPAPPSPVEWVAVAPAPPGVAEPGPIAIERGGEAAIHHERALPGGEPGGRERGSEGAAGIGPTSPWRRRSS